MQAESIRKVLIFDQGDRVSGQLLAKARSLFSTGSVATGSDKEREDNAFEYVILKAHRTHNMALERLQQAIMEEKPELVLIGATALGEEIAPALGVRFQTGVAAHCVDIQINEEGRLTFIIPAFGGRAVGEIFIPEAKAGTPAIATVKPGIFPDPVGSSCSSDVAGNSKSSTSDDKRCGKSCSDGFSGTDCRVIDVDAMVAAGEIPEGSKTQEGFRLTEIKPREHAAGSIADAEIILCGGYGLGSENIWKKLQLLADKLGGASACTRAALDAGWGCSEDTMIGTSGKAVRPKVYIGFGISGAAHHLCGLTGADTIISINNDKNAEVFIASDYKGVFDAEKVIDELLRQIG